MPDPVAERIGIGFPQVLLIAVAGRAAFQALGSSEPLCTTLVACRVPAPLGFGLAVVGGVHQDEDGPVCPRRGGFGALAAQGCPGGWC